MARGVAQRIERSLLMGCRNVEEWSWACSEGKQVDFRVGFFVNVVYRSVALACFPVVNSPSIRSTPGGLERSLGFLPLNGRGGPTLANGVFVALGRERRNELVEKRQWPYLSMPSIEKVAWQP